MQEIKVMIPPEFILITKVELEELKDQVDERVWVGFSDIEKLTGLKRNKLNDILYRYKDEIDVFAGGFVKFPEGGRWSFNKSATLNWLKENHARIWKED